MAEQVVSIETRALNIRLEGPEATPGKALALFEQVLSRMGDPKLEAGGMGFAAERLGVEQTVDVVRSARPGPAAR